VTAVDIRDVRAALDLGTAGTAMFRSVEDLYPLCRSITGEGLRQTLRYVGEHAPLALREVASGTDVLDWTVPKEWTIRDAYVKNSQGERVVDFGRSNLHVVNYSAPVRARMSLGELRPHLHTLPDAPDWIPYRTSYYRETWGFCLSHRQMTSLPEDEYEVCIDSTLADGALSYGECYLPGATSDEVLISCHVCHPSLANDNLSGMVLWALLLRELGRRPRRCSYRFVIVPETIGAIAYLARNEEPMKQVRGGFVLTTGAGPGRLGWKSSFQGDATVDRAVKRAFAERRIDAVRYPFDINGSDERQYSTPGFRIPTVTITKDKYYEYDYYHTSLDDLDFISAGDLIETLKLYLSSIETLELDLTYRSLNPHGEPMLGRRGLYPQTGGAIRQRAAAGGDAEPEAAPGEELDAIRWLMFLSDGETTLLQIAEKTGLPMRRLFQAAERLRVHGLLERIEVTAERGR
jgi:aminopeptidase-like protein